MRAALCHPEKKHHAKDLCKNCYLRKTRSSAVMTAQRKLRQDTLAALGGVCVRCGFSDYRALQIDHINGCGNAERRKNPDYHTFMRRVRDGAPGYQLLCANCNFIKKHERKEWKQDCK